MVKYKFTQEDDDGILEVTYQPTNEDTTMAEFHKYARRIAALVGYNAATIDKYFGKESYN